ncbi:MAG: adenosylcobinamide amidohydrolase [Methanoregulaceae archaeon]|jgi:adenosylcobinamide hydrolase|nr:adenosylcobinamide amidohydrolase [Methanoregulaceae archaeon]
MKYYIRSDTLFIRGSFSAASTGPCGGLRPVSTVLISSPAKSPEPVGDPCRDITLHVAREGLPGDFFGLVSGNDIRRLCILQYDYITVFILASSGNEIQPDHITVVVFSGEGIAENALLQMIVTVTSAKARALIDAGLPFPAASEDHVIVAGEGVPAHQEAGLQSEAGWRVSECVLFGLPHALAQNVKGTGPALYVYSRLGGGHFVRWRPEECPYFPCHFPGQRCDYCYCPFYPCRDETLGQWVNGSHGGTVWNCSRCTLLHTPQHADYLQRHPEASLEELKKIGKTE